MSFVQPGFSFSETDDLFFFVNMYMVDGLVLIKPNLCIYKPDRDETN